MIKIAICDNEKNVLKNLEVLISQAFSALGVNTSVSLFESGKELLEAIEKQKRKYNVIFLDIDMPALSGLQTAKRIRELEMSCLLIFVTNMEQYVCDGYKYAAFRYVFKRRLSEIPEIVSDICKKLTRSENNALTFKYKDGETYETLDVLQNDILYLKVEKTRRVFMKTVYAEYDLLTKPLSEYQAILNGFAPVMRCYLINFNHVADMTGDAFIMYSGDIIPMGVTAETKKASREKYLHYLKGDL